MRLTQNLSESPFTIVIAVPAPQIPRNPRFWFIAFALWWVTLWILSSRPTGPEGGLEIPHLDKVAHFGYFFGGAGLLSAALFCLRKQLSWKYLTFIVVLILALTGLLDEFHQTHTPGRQGNDLGDLLADITGAFAGTQIFRLLSPLLSRQGR